MGTRKTACVLVLGDIGRSPRMQYHALSLAKCQYDVDLVGYLETNPIPDVVGNERIKITKLTPLPDFRAPRIMQYFLKIIWQTINLLMTLSLKRRSDYFLLQNPPAIPTMLVCWLMSSISKTKFIIDWHNYAYTIMALTHSSCSPIVKIAKWFEFFFGAQADAHICVTRAMKEDLVQHKICAKVLYDRPAEIFKPITADEKKDFLERCYREYPAFTPWDHSTPSGSGDNVELRSEGILFSSTSWTPDEDFKILLSALEDYDKASIVNKSLPRLTCVITGKGPMKDYYIEKIKKRKLLNVRVITPWLSAEDYPVMVASADLGVCLHTSSSGLDLPMKVVDMFGCGLPVCAYKFQCINELVQDGHNGYVFETSAQLSEKIIRWFDGFPNNVRQNEIHQEFRDNLKVYQEQRWHNNWELRCKPMFD